MAALNTYEMTTLLWHIAHRPHDMVSLGVFPADHLPYVRRIRDALAGSVNCCFVANTDPANRPGKHWVLFIATMITRNRIQLEYFDSYGLPMPMYADLYAACIRNGYLKLVSEVSTVYLQDSNSSVCGYWCLLVAHFRAIGRTFTFTINYLRSRGKTAKQRDKYVVLAIHSVLHRRRYFTNHNPNCLASSSSSRGFHQSCCAANY